MHNFKHYIMENSKFSVNIRACKQANAWLISDKTVLIPLSSFGDSSSYKNVISTYLCRVNWIWIIYQCEIYMCWLCPLMSIIGARTVRYSLSSSTICFTNFQKGFAYKFHIDLGMERKGNNALFIMQIIIVD